MKKVKLADSTRIPVPCLLQLGMSVLIDSEGVFQHCVTGANGQVNNAAIAVGPSGSGSLVDYENAKEIVETNYDGVKTVTAGLLPLLRPSPAAARIVIVTSRAGLYEVDDS